MYSDKEQSFLYAVPQGMHAIEFLDHHVVLYVRSDTNFNRGVAWRDLQAEATRLSMSGRFRCPDMQDRFCF